MDVHGRAIYGTRPYRVWHEGDDLRFTQSKDGKKVYIFFLKKPATAQITLKALEGLPAHARIRTLDSGQAVKWKKIPEGAALSLPPAFLQAQHPVGVLEAYVE
jgi:alpha-L-fucosidase